MTNHEELRRLATEATPEPRNQQFIPEETLNFGASISTLARMIEEGSL